MCNIVHHCTLTEHNSLWTWLSNGNAWFERAISSHCVKTKYEDLVERTVGYGLHSDHSSQILRPWHDRQNHRFTVIHSKSKIWKTACVDLTTVTSGLQGPAPTGDCGEFRSVTVIFKQAGNVLVHIFSHGPHLDVTHAFDLHQVFTQLFTAKLIKVYTWFAHWGAGGRKGFLRGHLLVCKQWKIVYIVTKKGLHQRGDEAMK